MPRGFFTQSACVLLAKPTSLDAITPLLSEFRIAKRIDEFKEIHFGGPSLIVAFRSEVNGYRVLLTGIHLMRTGVIEANLVTLNEEFRLHYIADLVARKLAGPEKSKLEDADIAFHEAEYQRLLGELQAAHDASQLPELPSDETRAALNDLLVRVRLNQRSAS
jgi:predicted nucleotidyltransferase